jgi:ribosomal protein S18 acetylase RimI-like enzyme
MGLFIADEDLARFQSVETDPDFRRLGLAGSLLHHVSEYGFRELRARTLVICADPDYVAIELYRAVGFAQTETAVQLERDPAGSQHDATGA